MERRRHNIKRMLLACVLLLLVALMFFLIWMWEDSSRQNTEDPNVSQSDLGSIEFEGKRYRYNSELFNILFMGIDNDGELLAQDIPGDAGQADCIMILSLNKGTKEVKLLQIPRDTITEIDTYDASGNRLDTTNRQIALQYAYGSGGESSCWAVKKTVSELLYDLNIDAYLALDIASIGIINDAVGGVTIILDEDYTEIDPAFVAGATLTLTGDQARSFVRYRDTSEDFSNQERMERQLKYIPAMIMALKDNLNSERGYYDVFYPLVEKYMFTDLREDQIDTFADFELSDADMVFLPGEWSAEGTYDEYHVNDRELQEYLIETFYISVNE